MKTKIDKTKSSNKGSSPFFNSKNDSDFFSVQPKLKVGQSGDKYEVEADRVADEVVNFQPENQPFFAPAQTQLIQPKPIAESITPLIQRQEEEEEEMQTKLLDTTVQRQEEEEEELQMQIEEEEMLQMQPIEEEEEMLQPKSNSQLRGTQSATEQLLNGSKGNGSPLNSEIQSQMEGNFGADFSSVKIHTDNTAVQMNKELGAQAFTAGNNIYFNEGKYNPKTQNGKKLLAHELTHTVQQGSSTVQPYIQREITATTSPTTEREIEETATCDEATQREKETFINHGIYGPRSLSPGDTRTGGFEASYNPANENLNIVIRGKTRFINGLSIGSSGLVGSHGSDLSGLARLLNYIGDDVLSNTIVSNYYTWNETQRNESTINFRERISDTIWQWQDVAMLHFVVNESCWDDIQANVNINIDVQDAGVAAYSNATDSSNDHLQVSLVKNPERDEYREVQRLIQTTAQRIGDSRLETIDTSARLTTGASVHSSRRGGGRNRNPYDSEMTLSNTSLQNTPSEVNNFNRSMLRNSVKFARNESELDAGDKAIIDQFIINFTESDTNTENSYITLVGHASRLGSTSANRRLVAARLSSVMNYLREKSFPNIETRVQTDNRSDLMAERYDDTESNASAFRRVEIIVGGGGLQNTVAHEFGHVFGLLDEYATEGTSFTGTGTVPGTTVGHSGMSTAIGAGRVQSENSDNIMSMGNVVRAQHYGPFGWALNRITSKNWRVAND